MMDADQVAAELKAMADQWDVPEFDSDQVAGIGDRRARRTRLAVLISTAMVLGAASAAAGVLVPRDTNPIAKSEASTHADDHRSSEASSAHNGMAPAMPPPARVTPLTIGGHATRSPYRLTRTVGHTAVILKARLSFAGGTSGRARQTRLLLAKPGTFTSTAGSATDPYPGAAIAVGDPVTDKSPHVRVLTVRTPSTLTAGRYPILWTGILTSLPRDSELDGPFNVTGQIGTLIVQKP